MNSTISSHQNGKIKEAMGLRDRKDRDRTGLFLIEGYRELKRAVEGGWRIQRLFYCPEFFLGTNEQGLIDQIGRECSELFICTESVFRKLSYRDRPDGLLAIGVQVHLSLETLLSSQEKQPNPLFFIAEGIEKPGNLGTILRSADGAGTHGVIICNGCTDIYNPNVVRSSVGTLFHLPIATAQSADTISALKTRKIKIVAATPQARVIYTQADLTGPIAIAVGTEQLGLSDIWINMSDIQVSIPMQGIADSLNVASASSLLLYAILRQRGNHSFLHAST